MKPDKSTKIILIFIALGLWANAIAPLWHSRSVFAQDSGVGRDIHNISENIDKITSGLCLNNALCK
jgi:hypothetical protein